jgi:hypothetical protein
MAANDALNSVLVHGGFVDGSGWGGVYRILKSDGHNLSVVLKATSSLKVDVAVTKLAVGAYARSSLLVPDSQVPAGVTVASA